MNSAPGDYSNWQNYVHRGFLRESGNKGEFQKIQFFTLEIPIRSIVRENLHITVALSDEEAPVPADTQHPSLNYATGFVHQVASERMAGAYDNVAAFVAGPPPMVDGALRMLIVEARLPAADIRYDKFS